MKTKSEVFQIAKEMGWENPGPGIKRQIMGYDGQLMMVKVVFELIIGDEKRILEAGDGYYVAPDELHGCVCLEPGILIDTFSPMRADFLKE